jgi:hypothetical protein
LGPTLDEETAWALVRATLASSTGDAARRRVPHPLRADAYLDVEATGAWSASAPPSQAARELLDLYLPLTLDPDLPALPTSADSIASGRWSTP